MSMLISKTSNLKTQAVSTTESQRKGGEEATFQLADNRPEIIMQRKLQEMANVYSDQQPQVIQKKENKTGLPDALKSGIENLSGYSMDDVKVHRNSAKPAQLQAHAYAQGSEIHLGPGQEKHLPHEAWHVVQQKQGRVKPSIQLKNKVNINDDAGLEKEADVMGTKALASAQESKSLEEQTNTNNFVQRKVMIVNNPLKGLYDAIATVEASLNPPDTLMGLPSTAIITGKFAHDNDIFGFNDCASLIASANGIGNHDFKLKKLNLPHDTAKYRLLKWAETQTHRKLKFIMNEKFSKDHLISNLEDGISKSKTRFEKENLKDNLISANPKIHDSTWILSSINGILDKVSDGDGALSIASIYNGNQQLNTQIYLQSVKISVKNETINPNSRAERTKISNRISAIKKENGGNAIDSLGNNKYRYYHKDGAEIIVTFQTEMGNTNSILTGNWDIDNNTAEIYHFSNALPGKNAIHADHREWWVSEDEKVFYQPVRIGVPVF